MLFAALLPACDVDDPADAAADRAGDMVGEVPEDDAVIELAPLESMLSEEVDPAAMAPMGELDCFYGVGPGSSCIQCICADADTRQFLFYCSPCV